MLIHSRFFQFQSTLPRGSDPYIFSPCFTLSLISIHAPSRERPCRLSCLFTLLHISIHAPSRERLCMYIWLYSLASFQSTLPRGSDLNTDSFYLGLVWISIHAPSRERQHQNKLLLYSFKSSIFCELAQLKYSKIYFDVRKLIVSHSSLSCEPKLNFMFHITSHRIILHYFYSCQSICK